MKIVCRPAELLASHVVRQCVDTHKAISYFDQQVKIWHASQLPLKISFFKQILSKSTIKSIITSMVLSMFKAKLLRQLNNTLFGI